MKKCKKCGHAGEMRHGVCRQIVGAECLDPYGEECGCECNGEPDIYDAVADYREQEAVDLPLVLFTGSRDWPVFERIEEVMTRLWQVLGPYRAVHGGARGVDTFVDIVACSREWPEPIIDTPNYAFYGRYEAPKLRNTYMLERQPDYVVAFWREGSTTGGTLDCITKAVNVFRIPTIIYRR